MPGNVQTVMGWLEQHLLTCPSKKMFLLDCPGCGLQRSLLALLKGEIVLSWKLYPPTVFVLLTLATLVVHLVFNLRHGTVLLKFLFTITLLIMAVSYIYKIINHQLI